MSSAQEMRVEYMALSELMKLPRNPKDHDIPKLGQSMDRFGFVAPPTVDEASGCLAAGHGRVETLEGKKAGGEDPPERIHVRDDGEWMIPIIRGIAFQSERELEAYAVADNKLTEAGGWHWDKLSTIIRELAAEGDGNLDGLGFEEPEINRMMGMVDEGDSGGVDPEGRIKMVECPSCGHEWAP